MKKSALLLSFFFFVTLFATPLSAEDKSLTVNVEDLEDGSHEVIIIYSLQNSNPNVSIAFEVDNSKGDIILLLQNKTDENGEAMIKFRLPKEFKDNLIVYASAKGENQTISKNFTVGKKEEVVKEYEKEFEFFGLNSYQLSLVAVAVLISSSLIGGAISEPFRISLGKLFFLPLWTRINKEEALNDFRRGEIYGIIKQNPGIHYSEIMRRTGIGNGALINHLTVLEKKDYVKAMSDGFHKRYYPKEYKVGEGFVLSEIQEKIINVIKQNPGITQSEVARKLGESKQVINYHLKLLEKVGKVKIEEKGRETKTYLKGK